MTAPNLCHITPLFSSSVSQMKAFPFADEPWRALFLHAGPGPVLLLLVAPIAAFSDVFIHF